MARRQIGHPAKREMRKTYYWRCEKCQAEGSSLREVKPKTQEEAEAMAYRVAALHSLKSPECQNLQFFVTDDKVKWDGYRNRLAQTLLTKRDFLNKQSSAIVN